MILAITEEGKILLNNFATLGHSDLFHPKNIFHYISGLVNNILKGFKDYEKTPKRKKLSYKNKNKTSTAIRPYIYVCYIFT